MPPAPTHFRTCSLCEAMCGVAITVEHNVVTDIRGDHLDPFSRGHVCPKAWALKELHEDPDRLRFPVRRDPAGKSGAWHQVSWDDALDEAADRLSTIRARDGKDAVGMYIGNPTVHNHGAILGLQGFVKALGTKNRFDANSQDANPRLLASILLYGDQLAIPVPDVDRTTFMLMLGANPAASNGSLMTLGDVKGRLRGIRERGGRLVLIDPRRTETADWATEHHFIRPGADAALVAALLHVVFAEGLAKRDAAQAIATGLGSLERAVADFSPERVTGAVGIAPEVIRGLARDFAGADRAIAYGRIGVSQNPYATACVWLLDALAVVTGHFDREGCLMFPDPAVDVGALGRKLQPSSYGRWRSRVRGLPEVAGQLPAACIAEEIETPGPGQIRGFITLAGNPALSTPNSARLDAALATLEFMVSIDIYVNETTRHAHLVLPPVSPLERSHYDLVFHALAARNGAKWSPPTIAPDPAARTDWDILYDLGMRLGGMRFGVGPVDRALALAHKAGLRPTADQVVDLALRTGAYGDKFLPFGSGLSLSHLKQSPHGVDLGPLRRQHGARVRFAEHRLDLAPQVLVDDLARVAAFVDAPRAPGALTLIGRRHVRTNNSWMHNCRSLTKGPDRSALLVHPDDAARLTIGDGDLVSVRSRAGEVTATASVSDTVMPGVVSLPHGYGHAAARETLHLAGALPGPNCNVLTDELLLDPLSGTAALSSVAVTVERR